MNIIEEYEFLKNRRIYGPLIYLLNNSNCKDDLFYNNYPVFNIEKTFEKQTEYNSIAIDYEDGQNTWILGGISSLNNKFFPSTISVGEIKMSYYKIIIQDDEISVETDITTHGGSYVPILKYLSKSIVAGHLSIATRFINYLKALNWIYPYYETIDEDKFEDIITKQNWFSIDNIDLYLEAIEMLKWDYHWS